jgi:hypothetical protein
MSSLQKFHRRTQSVVSAAKLMGSEAPIGGAGFYLGNAGDGISYMYVAPKSTEVQRTWGPNGVRGTVSTTNGLANTNTLYSLGLTIAPPAYHAKTLTNGGYNTWYLPAIDELTTLYSNKSATPFATANSLTNARHWSSTEYSGSYASAFSMGGYSLNNDKSNPYHVRAVRRSLI